jgi:hypothetical protein
VLLFLSASDQSMSSCQGIEGKESWHAFFRSFRWSSPVSPVIPPDWGYSWLHSPRHVARCFAFPLPSQPQSNLRIMGRLELRRKLVLAVLAESNERLLLHDRQAITIQPHCQEPWTAIYHLTNSTTSHSHSQIFVVQFSLSTNLTSPPCLCLDLFLTQT